MRKSNLIFVTLVPFLLAACDDGQRVPLGEQHSNRGGSSGSGLPATGGSSNIPATGGSSSLPTTGGSSSLPTTGGSSSIPPTTCDILTQICNVTLDVKPYLTACVGVGVSSCMVTRTNDTGDYGNFYNGIQGFSYEWGYQYRLKIETTPVADPPADGSSVSYRLLEIVSKTPVATSTEFDVTLAPLVRTAEDLGFVFSGDCTAGYTLFGKPLNFDAGMSCGSFRAITSAMIPNSVRLRFSTPEGPLSVIGTTPTSQCSDGSPLPTSIPARQKVTFNLRNNSSERRFIVQTGVSCNAFGIQEIAGTGATDLILRTPSIGCDGQCRRCECDGPPPFASEILAIEPGGTQAFEWNATAYVSCQAPIPACPEQLMTVHANQAVAPGSYRALVPIATALPTHCSPTGENGVFSCSSGGLSACVSQLSDCPLDKTVTVDFSVPESGDIQVDVPIP